MLETGAWYERVLQGSTRAIQARACTGEGEGEGEDKDKGEDEDEDEDERGGL
jgi:hypothetical protein